MKKTLLFLLLLFGTLHANDGVVGFWKTIDEKSGKQQSIIAIYPYGGKYYGRIIATYDEWGVNLIETTEAPKSRAPGVKGHPFYCGMDIIWNLQRSGPKLVNGKILDPEHGKVYDAEMWTKNGNLIVRGKILCFGRNQTWLPVRDTDLPAHYQKPDLAQLVPAIPRVR